MTTYSPVQGVFHAKVGRYNLNFYDAQRLCGILEATLATYNQLYAAWAAGYGKCTYVKLNFLHSFSVFFLTLVLVNIAL